MLLELTGDYMRFLNVKTLEKKRHFLQDMNALLPSASYNKQYVKKLYQGIFTRQLDLIVAADPKKPEKLAAAKAADLEQHDETGVFTKVTMAMDREDLEAWAKEIVAAKAKAAKKELEEKKLKKKGGFWGSVWGGGGGGGGKKESDEQQSQFLDDIEHEAAALVEDWAAVQGHVAARKQIPNIAVRFEMKELKLTLLDNVDDYKGLMLYSKQIEVDVRLFDASNKYNKRSMELVFDNESYGVFVVEKNQATRRIDSSPFVQLLGQDDGGSRTASQKEEKALRLTLAQGNVNHIESDLPPEEIDETDLEVGLRLLPVEIIFRSQTITFVTNFFKAKHLKSATVNAAVARVNFEALSAQVNSYTATLEADFRNNKIDIKIAAPTFVVPFD